jgi:hypothetical protein
MSDELVEEDTLEFPRRSNSDLGVADASEAKGSSPPRHLERAQTASNVLLGDTVSSKNLTEIMLNRQNSLSSVGSDEAASAVSPKNVDAAAKDTIPARKVRSEIKARTRVYTRMFGLPSREMLIEGETRKVVTAY